MTKIPQIHGALLEEIVLILLTQAGYRQIVVGEEGTSPGVAGLEVEGRGSPHQIDALVTPIHSHSFIYPIRLIVEAKCENRAVGVGIIRSLVGTLLDLNQYFIRTDRRDGDALFMQRFNYHAAIFAANGFSERAERYALAHQIFMIDYTNTSLLRPVIDALLSLELPDFTHEEEVDPRFAMNELRERFRQAIATNGDIPPDSVFSERGLAKIRETLLPALGELRGSYYGMIQGIYPVHLISRQRISPDLILRRGAIPCEIRVSNDNLTWAFEPSGVQPLSPDFFHLEFSLPDAIAETLRSRAREAGDRVPEWLQVANLKRDFLRYIDISALVGDRMVGFRLLLDEDWLDRYVQSRRDAVRRVRE